MGGWVGWVSLRGLCGGIVKEEEEVGGWVGEWVAFSLSGV